MAIRQALVSYTGINDLLVSNPQTVDPLNTYQKQKAVITSKKKKTDEDIIKLRELDVESKVYFDPEIKVYIPTRWVMASLCGCSWTQGKIAKGAIRSAVFMTEEKVKLHYDGEDKVKEIQDISKNPHFHTLLLLKQQQQRIAKAIPRFANWSFTCELEFDETVLNFEDLKTLLKYGAKYGGMGDFRPTFGRAVCEVEEI